MVDELLQQVTELQKEVVVLRTQVAERAGGDTTDTEVLAEFEARCRNLEDENTILKGQVNDFKTAVTKAAAAAELSTEALAARDSELEALRNELASTKEAAAATAISTELRLQLQTRVEQLQDKLDNLLNWEFVAANFAA